MNISDTLICFFFFSLRGRNTGLINAEILVRTGEEGGNITVRCKFIFSGTTKIFCKEPCEQEDILIETNEDTAESGRYSIEYEKRMIWEYSLLNVTITKLKKSDAGKYRCGLDRSVLWSSSSEFEIRVEEAPISSQPTVTVQPSSASVPSASTETTTQSVSSSTGSCTPPSAPPEGRLLYVGLSLAVIIVVLLAAALILCKKRASKPKDHPVDTIYSNHTEDNRVYEEIREEDRRSSSAPVDISSLYTSVKYNTQNEVETTDVYSLATAATSHETAKDSSNKLIYSNVDFDKTSLSSASCGERDNVIYSVPRAEGAPR